MSGHMHMLSPSRGQDKYLRANGNQGANDQPNATTSE